MNTHYFHFINQILIFKTKGSFYGNKFSKSSCFALFLRIIDFFMVFEKIFYSKQTNHKNQQISKLAFG